MAIDGYRLSLHLFYRSLRLPLGSRVAQHTTQEDPGPSMAGWSGWSNHIHIPKKTWHEEIYEHLWTSMNIYEHLWNPQRCRQILPSFIIISKLFCKIGPPGRPHSRSHSRSPGQETFLWRTHLLTRINVVNPIVNLPFGHLGMVYTNLFVVDFGDGLSLPHGSVSKPCTPSVHIKIAGIYGCSSP